MGKPREPRTLSPLHHRASHSACAQRRSAGGTTPAIQHWTDTTIIKATSMMQVVARIPTAMFAIAYLIRTAGRFRLRRLLRGDQFAAELGRVGNRIEAAHQE